MTSHVTSHLDTPPPRALTWNLENQRVLTWFLENLVSEPVKGLQVRPSERLFLVLLLFSWEHPPVLVVSVCSVSDCYHSVILKWDTHRAPLSLVLGHFRDWPGGGGFRAGLSISVNSALFAGTNDPLLKLGGPRKGLPISPSFTG